MPPIILVGNSTKIEIQITKIPIERRYHTIEIIIQPFFTDEIRFFVFGAIHKNILKIIFGKFGVLFIILIPAFAFGIMCRGLQFPVVGEFLVP